MTTADAKAATYPTSLSRSPLGRAQDVLMQGFPDAATLGAALVAMEEQPVPPGLECATASLGVLAVLVQVRCVSWRRSAVRRAAPLRSLTHTCTPCAMLYQAVRRDGGPPALAAALAFLGRVGIQPDQETMEYFSMPAAPAPGSANSRHHTRLLAPHKERVRSLMDINMPAEYAPPELALPVSPTAPRAVQEPYFESGQDEWKEHARALSKALVGADVDEDDGGDGDSDVLVTAGGEGLGDGADMDVERLLLEGAFGIDDDDDDDDNDGAEGDGLISLQSRRGSGPFGKELLSSDYLDWPELADSAEAAAGPAPATLLPLEIQESFLSQARPRAKAADVWTPAPKKRDDKDKDSDRGKEREKPPAKIVPRAPAPRAPRASGGIAAFSGFDQEFLEMSAGGGGGGGKYSEPPLPHAGAGANKRKTVPPQQGARTAPYKGGATKPSGRAFKAHD